MRLLFKHRFDTNATSINMPILSERFSMSASSQYYAVLPSIKDIVRDLTGWLCKDSSHSCVDLLRGFADATYLDIDYDTISRALVINAGFASAPTTPRWAETITKREGDGTVEIGILNHEPNPDPEDVQFGGFLVVLGEDDKPSTFVPPLINISY